MTARKTASYSHLFYRCPSAVRESQRSMRFLQGLAAMMGTRREVLRKLYRSVRTNSGSTHSFSLEDGVLLGTIKTYSDVHVCRVTEDGHFTCTDGKARLCNRIHKGPCSHVCALMVWALLERKFTSTRALEWMKRTVRRLPDTDKKLIMPTLLSPLMAAELDWRPNVPVPEDHYAL